MHKLKQENLLYRQNFEELRKTHGELQETCEDLNSQLELSKAENAVQRRQHEEDILRLKQELKQRIEEFEQQRQEILLPPDMKVLRYQFAAEFEQEYKQRTDEIQSEVEKWQKAYQDLQQEMEKFQIQVKNQEAEYQHTLEDLNTSHQEDILRLSYDINTKNSQIAEFEPIVKRLRTSERENSELQLKVKALLTEIDDLNLRRTDDKTHHELELRNLGRKLAELESEFQRVNGEKEALRGRLGRLEEELRGSNRRLDDRLHETDHLRKEVATLTNNLHQVTHQFKVESSDQQLAFMKERKQWEQERNEHKTLLGSKLHELAQRETIIKDLHLKLDSVQKNVQVEVRRAREEEWTRHRDLESAKQQVENQLQRAHVALQQLKEKADFDRKALQHQLQQVTEDCHKLGNRSQLLAGQNDKLVAEPTQLREEMASIQKRSLELEERLLHQKSETDKTTKQLDHLRHQLDIAESEYRHLQQEHSSAQDRFTQHTSEMDRRHSDLVHQLRDTIKSLESQLHDSQTLAEGYKTQIATLSTAFKKLKQGYKNNQDDLHRQLDQMREEMDQVQVENVSLRKSLENDNYQAQLKLRDMVRRQEDFYRFLKSEGLTSTNNPSMNENSAPIKSTRV